jgi:type II secretory pathway pseudopilin PulG
VGQQQLLLIILGVIVVGLAVAIAVGIFADNAADRNRDAILSDMLHLVAQAQKYYRKPSIFGGGNSSYTGLTNNLQGMQKLVNTVTYPWTNANGNFYISTAGSDVSVFLKGVGREPGKDEVNPVVVTIAVYPDSFTVVTSGGANVYN